jgi:Tol biopolymer transport system component
MLCLSACASLPFFPGKSGLIAYVGADGNIYVVDQSGISPIAVTDDANVDELGYRVYGEPAWSRDGKSLAFVAYEGEGQQNPNKNSLYVAQKDGSKVTEAYTDPNFIVYHYWAPDGKHVGLLSETPGQTLALKLVPAAGGDTQTLDTGSPLYWTWAPDSHSVLIHAGGQNGRLAFLQLEGGVVEQGLEIAPSSFKAPAFAPDGQHYLIGGQTSEGKAALLLADVQGSLPTTLVEYGDANDIAFAWSPDGARVAYIAGQQLAGPVAVMDPSSPQGPLVTEGDAYAFFWSPDSRSLAYLTLEQSPSSSADPQRVVMGLQMLDVAKGESRQVVTFQPTERFLQMIPYFDQYHQSVTIWSPDSQRLVLSGYGEDNSPGIYIISLADSAEPEFIADGFVGVWSWK